MLWWLWWCGRCEEGVQTDKGKIVKWNTQEEKKQEDEKYCSKEMIRWRKWSAGRKEYTQES